MEVEHAHGSGGEGVVAVLAGGSIPPIHILLRLMLHSNPGFSAIVYHACQGAAQAWTEQLCLAGLIPQQANEAHRLALASDIKASTAQTTTTLHILEGQPT